MPIAVDHEERRRKVAGVVADIIATDGLEGVTVRSVAKKAGFSTAIVSHYFSGMRELLLYSYRMAQHAAYARLDAAVRAAPKQPERALDALLPHHEDARRDWLVWSVFWALAISDTDFSAVQREQFRVARRRLANLLKSTRALSSAEADAMARSLLASLIGLAMQATFDPKEWPREKQRSVLRSALSR